jgi:hypothetical protein
MKYIGNIGSVWILLSTVCMNIITYMSGSYVAVVVKLKKWQWKLVEIAHEHMVSLNLQYHRVRLYISQKLYSSTENGKTNRSVNQLPVIDMRLW